MNITKLIGQLEQKVGQTLFIAIDGHGGSGKSTLAKWIGEKLNAEIVETDDFASWDNPLDWWPQVIEKVFEPIQVGEKYLTYDRTK